MHGIVGTVDTVGGEVCQECQECHAKFCMAKLTNLTNLKRDDFANFAKLVMQKICFALSTLFALLRGESAESANSAIQIFLAHEIASTGHIVQIGFGRNRQS